MLRRMLQRRARRWREDSGQGLVEYALILALASVGIVFALLILRDSIGYTVQDTSARIGAAPSATGASVGGTETGATGGGGAGAGGGTSSDDGGKGGKGQHGNGKGNSGSGQGNGGPNGRKD